MIDVAIFKVVMIYVMTFRVVIIYDVVVIYVMK